MSFLAWPSEIVSAIRAAGGEAEMHEFAGEGHGFRKAETVRRVLEIELAFLDRIGASSEEPA